MDAITQRVDSFVAEILSLAGRAQDERRADALALVSRMLGGTVEPSRHPPEPQAKRGRGRPRKNREPEGIVHAAPAAPAATVAPAATAPRKRGRPKKVVAPAPANARAAEPPPAPVTIPSASTGAGREATDREALVLDAVRSLVRATAGEVAERCGQPNGSVYVALRALVAHGQVARTKTAKGVEYSLPG
jgi:hypothetical protein